VAEQVHILIQKGTPLERRQLSSKTVILQSRRKLLDSEDLFERLNPAPDEVSEGQILFPVVATVPHSSLLEKNVRLGTFFGTSLSRDDRLQETFTPFEDHPHFEADKLKTVGLVGY
jgi:hypothetical protein